MNPLLQHFMKILKVGGKAGIVIKNTFLSNTDNAAVSLRKEFISSGLREVKMPFENEGSKIIVNLSTKT